MTDDTPMLSDLAGIFAGDRGGPHPSCRLCGDLIGWSTERAEGDICRDCAATIADPETLRTLAQWFDNPNQTKAVVGQFGDQKYTLGMIFREVADAIDSQAGTGVTDSGESSATSRSTTTATAESARPLLTAGTQKGAGDDRH